MKNRCVCVLIVCVPLSDMLVVQSPDDRSLFRDPFTTPIHKMKPIKHQFDLREKLFAGHVVHMNKCFRPLIIIHQACSLPQVVPNIVCQSHVLKILFL